MRAESTLCATISGLELHGPRKEPTALLELVQVPTLLLPRARAGHLGASAIAAGYERCRELRWLLCCRRALQRLRRQLELLFEARLGQPAWPRDARLTPALPADPQLR